MSEVVAVFPILQLHGRREMAERKAIDVSSGSKPDISSGKL
jgi:hypothetical protein